VHTGVDLYTPVGTKVYAVEEGVIVGVELFTGKDAGSPWYNETEAILVSGKSGVVLYGEVEIQEDLEVGQKVLAGQLLGTVQAVLKEDKGNGCSMLHFELYRKGTKSSVWWHHGKEQPKNLLDPTQSLLALKVESK